MNIYSLKASLCQVHLSHLKDAYTVHFYCKKVTDLEKNISY